MRPHAVSIVCLLALAPGLFAQEQPAPLDVHFLSPSNGELTGRQAVVHAVVDCGDHGSWSLQDVGNDMEPLAQGIGPVAGDQPLWSGEPDVGRCRLRLTVSEDGVTDSDECVFLVAADELPGWPLPPCGPASGLAPMPEAGFESLLAARVVDGEQELLLLDGAGVARPGWPVALGTLDAQLPVGVRPLLLDEGPGAGVYVLGKSRLLALSSLGTLLHERIVDDPVVAGPVLGWQGPREPRLRLLVAAATGTELRSYATDLTLTGSVAVPGQAVKGLAPVLVDWSPDGHEVVLLALQEASGLSVAVVDPQGGGFHRLHDLGDLDAVALTVGELDGDWIGDGVLTAKAGKVVAFDRTRILWTRAHSDESVTSPALVDLDGDGAQEAVYCGRDGDGELKLHAVRGDGAAVPALDGLVIGDTGKVRHAPAWYVDDEGRLQLLLVLEPDDSARERRLLRVDPAGSIEETAFRLPGRLVAPPRLLDVDDDGRLDLAVADDCGTLAVWPLAAPAGDASHAYGDRRQSGCWLRPLSALPADGVLGGRVAVDGRLDGDHAVRLHDFTLASGELALSDSVLCTGTVRIAAGAVFELSGTALVAGPTKLESDGRLRLIGGGAEPGSLPVLRRPESALLQALDLRSSARSVLELRACTINSHPLEFQLAAGSLELADSWWVGPGGLRLSAVDLRAERSLFKADGTAIELLAGSEARLEDCSICASDCGVRVSSAALSFVGGRVLTCGDGLLLSSGGSCEVDSVHFQGNGHDVQLLATAGEARLNQCDFVETRLTALQNQGSFEIDARFCYWDALDPVAGPALREPQLDAAILPLERPARVLSLGSGPMVDGDEPLEWMPVVFSDSGLPIHVEYRIYRLDNPWLPLPGHPTATTTSTRWRDPELHLHDRAFYRVTAAMGKPHSLMVPDMPLR